MEKILEINDVSDFKKDKEDYHNYEGFVIKTDKQEILIGVDNGSCCCESWGHIASEDDFKEFIGANLLEVKLADGALNTKLAEQVSSLDEGEAMFVDLVTSKGALQFVCYNSHNGYYAHSAIVKSLTLNHETSL